MSGSWFRPGKVALRRLAKLTDLAGDPLGVLWQLWRQSEDPRRPKHRVHVDAAGNVLRRETIRRRT